jgi:predicted MFS family arabinose efflux permease
MNMIELRSFERLAGSALMVSVFQVALAFGAFAGGELVDRVGLRSAFGLGVALSGLSSYSFISRLVRLSHPEIRLTRRLRHLQSGSKGWNHEGPNHFGLSA